MVFWVTFLPEASANSRRSIYWSVKRKLKDFYRLSSQGTPRLGSLLNHQALAWSFKGLHCERTRNQVVFIKTKFTFNYLTLQLHQSDSRMLVPLFAFQKQFTLPWKKLISIRLKFEQVWTCSKSKHHIKTNQIQEIRHYH